MAPGGDVVNSNHGKEWEAYFDQAQFNTKEAWKFEHCKDQDLEDLLRFLVPTLSPKQPTRVTKQLVSTIVRSWTGTRQFDWGAHIKSTIANMIEKLHQDRPTRVMPFIVHFYFYFNQCGLNFDL